VGPDGSFAPDRLRKSGSSVAESGGTASPKSDGLCKSAEEAWQELLDKDDRTSPDEYPDMCLITFDELEDFMADQTELQRARDEEATYQLWTRER
jgi:hypothetical protein